MNDFDIELNNLLWTQFIEGITKDKKEDEKKLVEQLNMRWRVSSRMKMTNNFVKQFHFTGGQTPSELFYEINIISRGENLDWINKNNFEDSSGTLRLIGEVIDDNFYITGMLILDDLIFNEAISLIKTSTVISSSLQLAIDGLQDSESPNYMYTWDNKNSSQLKVTNFRLIFHYGNSNLIFH